MKNRQFGDRFKNEYFFFILNFRTFNNENYIKQAKMQYAYNIHSSSHLHFIYIFDVFIADERLQ